MKSVKHILVAGATVAALGTALLAHAAPSPQTVNVQVTATVNGSCNLSNVADVSFGAVDPTSATTATTAGTITLQCNKGASPTLSINAGLNSASCPAAPATSRCMALAGEYLNYDLYVPSASGSNFTVCPAAGAGTVWDTTNTLNASGAFASAGGTSTISVCGQLPLPQVNVPANASPYADTVTVTATF